MLLSMWRRDAKSRRRLLACVTASEAWTSLVPASVRRRTLEARVGERAGGRDRRGLAAFAPLNGRPARHGMLEGSRPRQGVPASHARSRRGTPQDFMSGHASTCQSAGPAASLSSRPITEPQLRQMYDGWPCAAGLRRRRACAGTYRWFCPTWARQATQRWPHPCAPGKLVGPGDPMTGVPSRRHAHRRPRPTMPAAGLAKKSLDLAPIDARPFDDDGVPGSPRSVRSRTGDEQAGVTMRGRRSGAASRRSGCQGRCPRSRHSPGRRAIPSTGG